LYPHAIRLVIAEGAGDVCQQRKKWEGEREVNDEISCGTTRVSNSIDLALSGNENSNMLPKLNKHLECERDD
jgi:hypothetical protein